jgi:hypothetical protein
MNKKIKGFRALLAGVKEVELFLPGGRFNGIDNNKWLNEHSWRVYFGSVQNR